MGRIIVLLCAWILAVFLLCAGSRDNLVKGDPTRVLLISSYHPGFPTFLQQIQGIKSVFDQKGIVLDVEFMDKKRFADAENEAHFLELLSHKIRNTKSYDAVITADDDALLFLLKHKANLFPLQPAVFLGVNDIARAKELNGHKGFTGVIEAVSMQETVQMMLGLLPSTETVLALVDTTSSGIGDLNTFRNISFLFPQIKFAELSLGDHTFAEFAAALQKIDNKTAVLLLSAYVDKDGDRMQFSDSLRLILDNLRQPLFHLWYHGIGEGILGGKVISHEQQGKAAAELILRILAGEPAESIKVIEDSPNVNIVDYQILKKFHLEQGKLPDNTVFLNKPFSLYDQYKIQLWIGIIFFVIQTLLIIFLINFIHRNKKIERLLRESEERARAISDAAIDAIIMINQYGEVTYWNPAAKEIFGYTSEEIIGQELHKLLAPERYKIFHEIGFNLFQDTGKGKAIGRVLELEACHKDGHIIAVELSLSSIHNQEGWHAIGIVRDITERKRTLEALRESEERFKALHNASFGGMAIHDQGLILECNQGLSDISGYSQEELIDMDGLLLIAPNSRELVLRNIKAGYSNPYEATGIRKNGEEYPLRLEARNIPYKGKNVRSVEFRDISDYKQYEAEREKMQEQLVQAQKMESVGRLAGGVAHDFNNMLGVILGYSEIVLDQIDKSQPIYSALQGIHQAAQRSAELTRQLLAFARKQPVMPKVLDLNVTVEGMLKMLRRLIGEDIDLAWISGKDLGLVKIDPSQVDQILANLCVNSRDAIGDTGKVTIETSNMLFDKNYCAHHAGTHIGEYVMLAVSDNGCGMDAETRTHLFEPFFTTKEMGKGTGLGLAMVYGIVKQNNGFINVYSESGQGTSFKIYLPRYISDIDQTARTRLVQPVATGLETILLVEDEPMILAMTMEMLNRLGYTVLSAGTPKEALVLAQKYTGLIDLLITDVVMPEMNGRDLARNLLALYPDLKCLYMSGYTANVIAHHGVLDEGIYFLQKPFSRKDLADKVREALDKSLM